MSALGVGSPIKFTWPLGILPITFVIWPLNELLVINNFCHLMYSAADFVIEKWFVFVPSFTLVLMWVGGEILCTLSNFWRVYTKCISLDAFIVLLWSWHSEAGKLARGNLFHFTLCFHYSARRLHFWPHDVVVDVYL